MDYVFVLKLSQLSQPVRLLLAYTDTEHVEKFYEMGPAPDFDKSDFHKVKDSIGLDFPNLPYYIDGK
jgi:glutathione S-transferase